LRCCHLITMSIKESYDGLSRCAVLKPEQKVSIKSVYEGKDVFVCLSTGFGKSVCYMLTSSSVL